MNRIVQGVADFQRRVFPKRQQLFERLKEGQSPEALMITCSDSRIDPNLITQTQPGELFIMRNAGNIIPPYHDAPHSGEAGTIEYAVRALKINTIIICGHSHCGAMTGLMKPASLKELPAVSGWLNYARTTRETVEQLFSHVTDPAERLMKTVQVNVLRQMDNLLTHPSVREGVEAGNLQLHAWVYEFETGTILVDEDRRLSFDSLVPEAKC